MTPSQRKEMLIQLLGKDEAERRLRERAKREGVEPSDADLLTLWRSGATPFKDLPFDQAKAPLSRWYVGQRLAHETEAYFQNARARVTMSVSRR